MPVVNIAKVWANGDVMTAAAMNANPTAFAAGFANIDNVNIGPAGIFASQIIPTTVAQATFAGSLNYTFPLGIITAGKVVAAGGVAATNGFQTTTASGMGFYTGTGVPSFSAPNGTGYYRFDSATAPFYINTSGANTSGTTWSAVPITAAAPYAAQARGAITYTTTGSETNASPGTMGTASITLPTSSPGTNGNWNVFVHVYLSLNGSLSTTTQIGIGGASAGTTAFPMYASTSSTAHVISGSNCISDAKLSGIVPGTAGDPAICDYSAIYANAASLTFTALLGVNVTASTAINGGILIQALPN